MNIELTNNDLKGMTGVCQHSLSTISNFKSKPARHKFEAWESFNELTKIANT